MEALVLKENSYQWVKLDLNRCTFESEEICDTNGYTYYGVQILKYKNDIRRRKNSKYIRCVNCGEIMKESEWERHLAKSEWKANCINCSSLKKNNSTISKASKITQNEDGTMSVTQKITFNPYCTYAYYPCDYSKKNNLCRYYQCRRRGKRELPKSAIVDYPNINSGNMITCKKLIDNGWKIDLNKNEYCFGYKVYKCANKKLSLSAYVDSMGLVRYFSYNTRSGAYLFAYSDYYDRFFRIKNNSYDVNFRDFFDTTDAVIEKVETYIRKLYK